MATIELRFTALPAHVRTARLVVAAVARRVGIDESTLDDIRLAVAEACSRAVALHRRYCPDDAVTVRLRDEDDYLLVAITDLAPANQAPANDDHPGDVLALLDDEGGDPVEVFPASLGIAVITGLVDDVEVRTGSAGSTIQMRWSVAAGNGLQSGPSGPS